MSKFNLVNFIKEAMGAAWGVYRTDPSQSGGEYFWFELKDVMSGQNEFWERWVRTNPSLRSVARECQSHYYKYMNAFQRRYGLDPNEIDKFFKVYIGYNPSWGAYMCSIGPYRNEGNNPRFRNIDERNRFSYFTKRFQRADEQTVEASYKKFIDEYFSGYEDVLDKGDISMDLTAANDVSQDGKTTFTHIKVDSLDSNEGAILTDNAPIQGTGTSFDINLSGKRKILLASVERHNLQDQLTACINYAATENNIPAEAISNFIMTGENPTGLDENKILNQISEKLKAFFPYIVESQAQQNGWGDVLDECIQELAQSRNMSPENIWATLRSYVQINENGTAELNLGAHVSPEENAVRVSLTKALTKKINDKKKQMLKESVIRPRTDSDEVKEEKQRMREIANSITTIPIFQEMGRARSGQQRPTELSVKTVQKSLLALKEEILSKIVDFQRENPDVPIDVQQIAESMVSGRKIKKTKATANWTEENVQFWIDEISQEMQMPDGQGGFQTRSFQEMLEQTRAEIEEAYDPTTKGSFPDFDTACRMASLYFMESEYTEIDPVTRFPITKSYNHPAPLFGREDNEENVTATELTAIRNEGSNGRTLSDQPAVDVPDEATEQDIAGDIGEVPAYTTPVEEYDEELVGEVPTETSPIETEEEEEATEESFSPRIRKRMFNSIRSLIKLSKELDDEGKSEASEEIHKIIRKYMD